MYCVKLDNIYGHKCVDTSTTDELECHQYIQWRNYSIVAMFVGSLTLFYGLLSIFLKYNDDDNSPLSEDIDDDCKNCAFTCVALICVVMITVTFAQLIKGGASDGDPGVTGTAMATIVVSGIGVAMPCLLLICYLVIFPVLRCVSEYI